MLSKGYSSHADALHTASIFASPHVAPATGPCHAWAVVTIVVHMGCRARFAAAGNVRDLLVVRVPRHAAHRTEEAALVEVFVQLLGHRLGCVVLTLVVHDFDGDFGVLRRLVGVVDTGEALDESSTGLHVQSLRVTLLANLDRDVHEHLDKVGIAGRVDVASQLTVAGVRGDEGDDGHDTGISEELGDLGHTADVLCAVLGGETNVAVEACADVVAVEDVAQLASVHEGTLEGVGDGTLATATEAGHPKDAATLVDQLLAHFAGHGGLVEADVGGLTNGRGGELVVAVLGFAVVRREERHGAETVGGEAWLHDALHGAAGVGEQHLAVRERGLKKTKSPTKEKSKTWHRHRCWQWLKFSAQGR